MRKTTLTFVLILISGLVIGGLIGDTLGTVPFLSWLNYGKQIGLDPAFTLNLSFFTMTFGATIKLNIAGIIGMVAAIIIYRRL